MPSVITTIRPTTELEAVNIMLGAIGELPLPAAYDLSTTTDANVEVSINLLKESVREILTAGWRFNTLTGFELTASAIYAWTDSAGTTTSLKVYKRPADVLAWSQTKCSQMQGIELIERMSLKYQETGAAVLVLFDRIKNRDGVPSATYPHLYLDAVFACDFTSLPESARKYATIVAARRLCQRSPASETQAGFQQSDEMAALRVLKREQGLNQDLNMFETADAYDFSGRRPVTGGGFNTTVYPGGA